MAFKSDIEAMILGVLQEGSLHGYEISRRIRKKSAELFAVGEGRLYPALHKLESEGKVIASWEPNEGKPPRRVYELTDQGRSALAEQRDMWQRFASGVGSILMMKPEAYHG